MVYYTSLRAEMPHSENIVKLAMHKSLNHGMCVL